MTHIDRAIDALIPIPPVDELKAADEATLLKLNDWLGHWAREVDSELRLRYKDR